MIFHLVWVSVWGCVCVYVCAQSYSSFVHLVRGYHSCANNKPRIDTNVIAICNTQAINYLESFPSFLTRLV